MADPTDPTTAATTATIADPNAAQNLLDTAAATDQAQNSLSVYSTTIQAAQAALGDYYDEITKVSANLTTNQNITTNQTTVLAALTTSALGARDSMTKLAGVDFSSVNTFTKQWQGLVNVIEKSPIAKTAEGLLGAMGSALKGLGLPVNDVTQKMKEGAPALYAYANAFFKAADNATKTQESIGQLASRVGNLNAVYGAAGPNLSNLNQLTENYNRIIDDSNKATHLGRDVMEQYYDMISQVPMALQSTASSATEAGKRVSMLVAATQLATGTQRQMGEVTKDLREAFRDYNITGDDALQFVGRMSELNNKFGVELEDVRTSLKSTAGMFQLFGNEAEGAAKMMNQYLGSLESTGISGAAALPIINNMTKGIQGMSLAQKAFLSAQTGGPGGLMGGFQIEKMLREGHLDQVMDKVKQTLTKQMGPLVSVDEAANDPAAAARLVKQRALLMQGPLGSLVGTGPEGEQAASRLIEGMKNQQSGKSILTDLAKPGGPGGTQDLMKQGVMWQEKTHTVANDILETISRGQSLAETGALTSVQKSATAVVGAQFKNGDVSGNLRRGLSLGTQAGANRSGMAAQDLQDAMKTGRINPNETVGHAAAELASDFKKIGKELLPEAITAPMKYIKSAMGGDSDNTSQVYNAGVPDKDMDSDDRDIANIMKKGNPVFNSAGGVGNAAADNANRLGATAAAGQDPNAPHRARSVTDTSDKNLGQLTVHVDGFCLDCGDKIKGHSQLHSIAPVLK